MNNQKLKIALFVSIWINVSLLLIGLQNASVAKKNEFAEKKLSVSECIGMLNSESDHWVPVVEQADKNNPK